MSKITMHSDRTPRARLAEKADIAILSSIDAANQDLQAMEQKVIYLQHEIEVESARKYPNSDFIANCQRKLDNLKSTIAFCKMQRQF